MPLGPYTPEGLAAIRERRNTAEAAAKSVLLEARAANRETLSPKESRRFTEYSDNYRGLRDAADEYEAELKRGTLPPHLAGLGTREVRGGSSVSPLGFDPEEMRSAHERLSRGETVKLTARAFSSASSLVPPTLYSQPLFPRHESRWADRLPQIAIDTPALEYVQVSSTSGAAAIVGEGGVKPEVTMPPTPLTCTAKKLAVHSGISWESWADFSQFTQAVQQELIGLIVDLENSELWGGTPATGLNGLVNEANILKHTAVGGASTPVNHWDDFSAALAKLRTGPALATPNLVLIHPDSWAVIRTEKDTLGRYTSGQDPTTSTAETVWGVEVLQSTAFPEGEAVVMDTVLAGKIVVRESIVMRLGTSGDDLVRNIIRCVIECRENVAWERPAAAIHITGLPVAAATTTRKSKA